MIATLTLLALVFALGCFTGSRWARAGYEIDAALQAVLDQPHPAHQNTHTWKEAA